MIAGTPGRTAGERLVAFIAALVVLALGVLVNPKPAAAAPNPLAGQCSVELWQNPSNFQMCLSKLEPVGPSIAQCVSPPLPESPDSGMPGWFASEPDAAKENGLTGIYSQYGYAGYSYITYAQGCVSPLANPTESFEDTIANGEFMIATSIIGAANALRERAWNPTQMWGWADPLVQNATQALFKNVFTTFGAITIAIVGLYLLWRSRQADMSNAVTTAGWAVFVMVLVTAIAAWPVRSAHLADATLIGGLDVVHSAISPQAESIPPNKCLSDNPMDCIDKRPPAVRASDTATENIIYRNWLRGLLGSADSPTAVKYGPVLYDATALTWSQEEQILQHPDTQTTVIDAKKAEWERVAQQIDTEDPQAYSYLQGRHGMDRIGAGFISILSALFFAMFDITASILVLIGFLIFRWAVVAAPLLGTLGILRPASSGLRRLANAVIAAIFNIIIFGSGAAVYLYAVDLIMSTPTLPGWLQVVLMWLVGVVGWLLLRPYRRITQMGGRDSTREIVSAGSWHRRFFRDMREAAKLRDVVQPGDTPEPLRRGLPPGTSANDRSARPETRVEDAPVAIGTSAPSGGEQPSLPATRRRPAGDWTAPDVPDAPANYSIYRPASSPTRASTTAPARPAHRPESAPTPN